MKVVHEISLRQDTEKLEAEVKKLSEADKMRFHLNWIRNKESFEWMEMGETTIFYVKVWNHVIKTTTKKVVL